MPELPGGDATALDRMVHEPARLAILAVLSAVDSADFAFLIGQTGLTKGNLSSHAAKLEDAGYITVEKTFVDRVPRTLYRLTNAGTRALLAYEAAMRAMLHRIVRRRTQ